MKESEERMEEDKQKEREERDMANTGNRGW